MSRSVARAVASASGTAASRPARLVSRTSAGAYGRASSGCSSGPGLCRSGSHSCARISVSSNSSRSTSEVSSAWSTCSADVERVRVHLGQRVGRVGEHRPIGGQRRRRTGPAAGRRTGGPRRRWQPPAATPAMPPQSAQPAPQTLPPRPPTDRPRSAAGFTHPVDHEVVAIRLGVSGNNFMITVGVAGGGGGSAARMASAWARVVRRRAASGSTPASRAAATRRQQVGAAVLPRHPPGCRPRERDARCRRGRPVQDLRGQGQRGLAQGNAVQHRVPCLLRALDPLPVLGDLLQGARLGTGEDVRITPDHLVDQTTGHVVDGPPLVLGQLLGEPRVQHHLQQHVAQLLAQRVGVVGADRVVRLVALLQQITGEAAVRLRPLPRVATRRGQSIQHGHRVEQSGTRRIPRAVHQLHLGQPRLPGQPQTQLPGQRLVTRRTGQPHHGAVRRHRVQQRLRRRAVHHSDLGARLAHGRGQLAVRAGQHRVLAYDVPGRGRQQAGGQPG